MIPVPAEWAGQDLAGRDEAESLEGLLSGTGGMVDGLNGWFVFAIGHGVGGADTYVYRTRDGGRTWQETGRPDPARMMWYPSYTYFIDSYTGFLGQSYFNDAPIFRTTDGGLTWEEITLQQEEEPIDVKLTPEEETRKRDLLSKMLPKSGSCPPCAPAARMS